MKDVLYFARGRRLLFARLFLIKKGHIDLSEAFLDLFSQFFDYSSLLGELSSEILWHSDFFQPQSILDIILNRLNLLPSCTLVCICLERRVTIP